MIKRGSYSFRQSRFDKNLVCVSATASDGNLPTEITPAHVDCVNDP